MGRVSRWPRGVVAGRPGRWPAGATSFVVVEGFSGAAGSFDLTLECF